MSSFDAGIARVAAGLFHIREFRPLQKEIIVSILERKNTLAVLPTGAGKSITYQIPAFILEGLTLVVTPLISLMKDQVRVLRERGVDRCDYLSSDRTDMEKRNILSRLSHWKVLYVTPERLESRDFTDRLKNAATLSLIVIDEAHCVSLWGNSFRPSYRRIGDFTRKFSGAVIAAFTGTASVELREDIRNGLGVDRWNVIAAGMARDNIALSVRYVTDKERYLLECLDRDRSAIVYTTSRFLCDRLHYRLEHLGYPVAVYHAGLPRESRDSNQKLFLSGEKNIMVATSAFGMGIDKPDIRDIYHYNVVPEAEEYFQEIGRAGRDGKESRAVMLVEPEDFKAMDRNIEGSFPGWPSVKRMLNKRDLLPSDRERMDEIALSLSLGSFAEIAGRKKDYLTRRRAVTGKAEIMKRYAASSGCRKVSLMRLFGETSSACGKCDYCVALRNDYYRREWSDRETALIALLGGSRKSVSLEELRSVALGLNKRDQMKSGFGTLRGTDMRSFRGIVCDLKNCHVLCLDTEASVSAVLNPLFREWVLRFSPFSFF